MIVLIPLDDIDDGGFVRINHVDFISILDDTTVKHWYDSFDDDTNRLDLIKIIKKATIDHDTYMPSEGEIKPCVSQIFIELVLSGKHSVLCRQCNDVEYDIGELRSKVYPGENMGDHTTYKVCPNHHMMFLSELSIS